MRKRKIWAKASEIFESVLFEIFVERTVEKAGESTKAKAMRITTVEVRIGSII